MADFQDGTLPAHGRSAPKLITRVCEARAGTLASAAPKGPQTQSLPQQINDLQVRVGHLEQLVQRPQDAVHRNARRGDDQIAEIQERIMPAPIAAAIDTDAVVAASNAVVPASFIPTEPERDGERDYQRLRIQTELRMGRAPRRRRIRELASRRGGIDCITTVGQPDPICGDLVVAIFDMGQGKPFIIYRQDPGDPEATTCELLATTAYTVSDFTS